MFHQYQHLQSVNDINDGYGTHQGNGFTDQGSFTGIEYQYDLNGNMISDLNKRIDTIHYNHLNLPDQIDITPTSATQEVNYLYNAVGQKLRKATRINSTPATTTDYVGSFIYQDGQLQTILTPEGRVVVDGNNYEYQYFLKDHLGNTRITFNESGTIIQEDSYYPFGMAMAGLSHSSGENLPNKYLYNGKELQDDFGLDWYDYGARFYDPTGVHWTTMDPLAEKYYSWTPYNYVLNNPIKSIDLDGCEPLTLSVLAARAVIGASLGIGIDIAVQMTVSMSLGNQSFGEAFNNLDWTSVGASAVTGAFGAPGVNLVSNTAKIAIVATALTTDAAFDISIAGGNKNIINGEKSLASATIDAAGSLIGGKSSGDIINSAKNSISKDISSGTFATLNKAEKALLKQTESVVNSQGFEAGTKLVVGIGAGGGKAGMKSILDGKDLHSTGKIELQQYVPPADNTNVLIRHPREFDPSQGGFY